jgi:hypothetical protein
MRAAAALVKFVLVPLLLVYTAILYAYAIKIALARELPKGTLGGMVVGYLLVGAGTLLVGYPSRETGGPLVRLFWRYWVELAALPVVLLFIAVGRRIADYGVTEQRYLMVLVGVWALILACIRLMRGRNFDLRLVPGVLAFLMFAASFGPGGAIGFSIMSQREQLAELLTEKSMLVGGKIVPRDEGAAESPLGTDAWRARSIEWYLNTHRALYLLAPWFAGSPNDPFAPGKKPEETARELLLALGLRADVANSSGVVYFTHYSDVPAVIGLAKDGHVIGPVVFQKNGPVPTEIPPRTVAVEGLGMVHLELADTLLHRAARERGGSQVRHPGRGEGDLSQGLAAHRGSPPRRDQRNRNGTRRHACHRQSERRLQRARLRHLSVALLAGACPRGMKLFGRDGRWAGEPNIEIG